MPKKFTGKVKSDVQDKTCVVTISRRVTHPLYGKRYIVSNNVQVHDEKNNAKKNDFVEIKETRPISKNKKFALVRVMETAHADIELRTEEVEGEEV
jgi:small subunit ribosomal protein S17